MCHRSPLAGFLSILALLCAARAVPAAPAGDLYTIDPAHTSIVFGVAHSGFSYIYGFFREASGNYIIDKSNPANCRFRLIIQATSLDTNNLKRDVQLRSADFFNVQQFPEITFDSTSCTRVNAPDNAVVFQVTGNLTMHGVTRQITVPLRMLGEGLGPFKDQRSGFLCQIELKRSDFEMNAWLKDKLVGDAVGITVSFEGSMQAPTSTAPRTDAARP